MSKTLDQMTITEIRRECAHRSLPITASRVDLQCMLEAIIRAEGNDPSSFELPPRQQIVATPPVDERSVVIDTLIQEEKLSDENTSQNFESNRLSEMHDPPLNLSCVNFNNENTSSHNQYGSSQNKNTPHLDFPDLHTIHSIRVASEEIGALRQDMRVNKILAQLEMRMSTIETAMTRYVDDQKVIKNRVAKIENDLKSSNVSNSSAFRPIVSSRQPVLDNDLNNDLPFGSYNDRTTVRVTQTDPHLNSRLNAVEQEVRDRLRITTPQTAPVYENERSRVEQPLSNSTGWDHDLPNIASQRVNNYHINSGQTTRYDSQYVEPNRTVQFSTTQVVNELSRPPTQNSTLIPIHDLKTARASLPQFSGRKEEDPIRFIKNSESILQQANIHKTAWVKTIDPQLTGSASDWFNTIRTLDLSWAEFKGELVERFDNPDIQARLRAEIVSFRQGRDQRLTDFVLEKNQLSRRVQTGLSEAQIVSTVVGLMREEFRTHARLQHPETFLDLRRIAAVLDVSSYSRPETQNKTYQPAKSKEIDRGKTPIAPVTQSKIDKNALTKAPLPCRYCKGPHWNKDCPTKRSENGSAPGGA